MEAASVPKSKSKSKAKAQPVVVSSVPAAILATGLVEPKASAIRFCPTCRYYLFLQSGTNTLQRVCRNCGYIENDEKGGLVMETSSVTEDGYKILVNEFTRYDVRLPHIVKTLKCPEPACKTNKGEGESDILYIKYDPTNLKYLYICTSCGYQWTSRR